jgi:nucleoside-diphosphate-sugar epimerase
MESVLITGANGEVGHGLIPALTKKNKNSIIALDIREIDPYLQPLVHETVVADVTDTEILKNLMRDHKVSVIFHLAAILSTGGEKNPERAIAVNAGGTEKLLEAANRIALEEKRVIKFLFPSTIAVYGLPNIDTKKKSGTVKEDQFLDPLTIYGITKLYCENLGKYYAENYHLLNASEQKGIDFRCVRFPGIISALTLPTGGTSDYAPEMIHSAAQGKGYESFVRPDTKISFMVMPDAVKALLQLSEVSKEKLKKHVYNVQAFSASAEEIAQLVNKVFPDSSISYNPDPNRQKIVDSWPEATDDSDARTDWGWQSAFDLENAFNEYLIPEIKNRYNNK